MVEPVVVEVEPVVVLEVPPDVPLLVELLTAPKQTTSTNRTGGSRRSSACTWFMMAASFCACSVLRMAGGAGALDPGEGLGVWARRILISA